MRRKRRQEDLEDLNELDLPLLEFPSRTGNPDYWRIREALEGTIILGVTGGGKTSGSGRALAHSFLSSQFGGMVLCAKNGEKELWEKYDEKCWLGDIEPLVDYGCPIKVFIRKRLTKKGYHYSYYATTLRTLPKKELMSLYNQRGGAEVEQFKGDKSGLHLETRQKGKFQAQEGIILLTDIAHNLLGNFYRKALEGGRFNGYGNKRIIRELLAIPGKLIFESGKLQRVELISGHVNSREMLKCLKKYCSIQ